MHDLGLFVARPGPMMDAMTTMPEVDVMGNPTGGTIDLGPPPPPPPPPDQQPPPSPPCTTCGDEEEKKEEEGTGDGTLQPGASAAAAEGAPPQDVAGTGPADAMTRDSRAVLDGSATGSVNPDGTATGSARGMAYAGGQNVTGESNYVRVVGGDGDISGTAGNGQATATATARAGMADMQLSRAGQTTLGGQELGASGNGRLTVLGASGTGTANISGDGLGASGEAQASLARVEASGTGRIGQLSGTGNLEGAQVYAKAEGQALLGTSGTRTGVALGGTIESGLVGGTAKGSVSVPIGWLPGVPAGTTVSFGGEAGGVLGAGPTAAGGGFAYYDSATGRYSAGAFAGGGLGVAGRLGLNMSVGPAPR